MKLLVRFHLFNKRIRSFLQSPPETPPVFRQNVRIKNLTRSFTSYWGFGSDEQHRAEATTTHVSLYCERDSWSYNTIRWWAQRKSGCHSHHWWHIRGPKDEGWVRSSDFWSSQESFLIISSLMQNIDSVSNHQLSCFRNDHQSWSGLGSDRQLWRLQSRHSLWLPDRRRSQYLSPDKWTSKTRRLASSTPSIWDGKCQLYLVEWDRGSRCAERRCWLCCYWCLGDGESLKDVQ